MSIKQLGWNSYFGALWEGRDDQAWLPARVISQQRGLWRIAGDFAESWAEAFESYRERLPKMIELAKAVAMAKLEVEGEYAAAKHDRLFENFGPGDLDVGEFPSYLICVDAADMHADLDRILQALAAGFPAKVLVQTDDLSEPSLLGGELLDDVFQHSVQRLFRHF